MWKQMPFPECSPVPALHCLSVQQTLHLSCTTGQVTVASSTLREISFTHTMTTPPASRLWRSYSSIYNAQILPAVLQILTLKCVPFSLLPVYYESKKRKKKKRSWGWVQRVCSVIRARKLSRVDLSCFKQWRQKLLLIPSSIQSFDGHSLWGTDKNGLHILPHNVNKQYPSISWLVINMGNKALSSRIIIITWCRKLSELMTVTSMWNMGGNTSTAERVIAWIKK